MRGTRCRPGEATRPPSAEAPHRSAGRRSGPAGVLLRRPRPGSGSAAAELRRHRLDAGVDGAGPDDDRAGSGDVLRRHGPPEERAHDVHAGVRDLLPDHRRLDDHQLQPRVQRRRRLSGRPVAPVSARHGQGHAERDDPGERVHDLPDDLRDHHARADHRRLCGSHEVLGPAVVHGALGNLRLRADRTLGVGPGGWVAGLGALDFAGGTVVHINAGIAGLVCAPRARQAASATATRTWRRTT